MKLTNDLNKKINSKFNLEKIEENNYSRHVKTKSHNDALIKKNDL